MNINGDQIGRTVSILQKLLLRSQFTLAHNCFSFLSIAFLSLPLVRSYLLRAVAVLTPRISPISANDLSSYIRRINKFRSSTSSFPRAAEAKLAEQAVLDHLFGAVHRNLLPEQLAQLKLKFLPPQLIQTMVVSDLVEP